MVGCYLWAIQAIWFGCLHVQVQVINGSLFAISATSLSWMLSRLPSFYILARCQYPDNFKDDIKSKIMALMWWFIFVPVSKQIGINFAFQANLLLTYSNSKKQEIFQFEAKNNFNCVKLKIAKPDVKPWRKHGRWPLVNLHEVYFTSDKSRVGALSFSRARVGGEGRPPVRPTEALASLRERWPGPQAASLALAHSQWWPCACTW